MPLLVIPPGAVVSLLYSDKTGQSASHIDWPQSDNIIQHNMRRRTTVWFIAAIVGLIVMLVW